MTAVSDAVVIGVVLGLVFAAVSYYLFTRVSQLERKVGLMENILLDLKVTTEQTLLSATEPHEHESPSTGDLNTYRNIVEQTSHGTDEGAGVQSKIALIRPFEDAEEPSEQQGQTAAQETQGGESRELFVESAPRARTPQQPVQVERDAPSVSVNYEAMTYKELVQYAKQKGMSGLRNLSKKEVIDVLRRRDGGGGATATGDVSDLSTWKSTTVSFGEGELQPLNDGATDIDGVGSFGGTMLGATPLEDTTEIEGSLVQSSD